MDTKALGFVLISALLLGSLAYVEYGFSSPAAPKNTSDSLQLLPGTGTVAKSSAFGTTEQSNGSCGLSPSLTNLARTVEQYPSFVAAEKGLSYVLVNAENETVATYVNATGVPMGPGNETIANNVGGNPGVLVSNITYTYFEFAAFSVQIPACNGIPKSAVTELEGILNVLVPITASGAYNISGIEIHYQSGLP